VGSGGGGTSSKYNRTCQSAASKKNGHWRKLTTQGFPTTATVGPMPTRRPTLQTLRRRSNTVEARRGYSSGSGTTAGQRASSDMILLCANPQSCANSACIMHSSLRNLSFYHEIIFNGHAYVVHS
jgi:hypothetical protein